VKTGWEMKMPKQPTFIEKWTEGLLGAPLRRQGVLILSHGFMYFVRFRAHKKTESPLLLGASFSSSRALHVARRLDSFRGLPPDRVGMPPYGWQNSIDFPQGGPPFGAVGPWGWG